MIDLPTPEQWDAFSRYNREFIAAELQHEPRPIRPAAPPKANTGATIRLQPVCRACGDALPSGARFCITCGVAVRTKP